MTNPNELYDEQKKTLSERQTWNFPPKPDVSVTHLRDVHGRVWERHPNDRWYRVRRPNNYGYNWYQLFTTNAPLTDATGDYDED